jgi:hypothetical protein
MPKNRSEDYSDKQNKAGMSEEAQTLKAKKQKEFPPSLNNINKNETDEW